MADLPRPTSNPAPRLSSQSFTPIPASADNIFAPGTKNYAVHIAGGAAWRVDDPPAALFSDENVRITQNRLQKRKKPDAARTVGGWNLAECGGIVVTSELEIVSESADAVAARDRSAARELQGGSAWFSGSGALARLWGKKSSIPSSLLAV